MCSSRNRRAQTATYRARGAARYSWRAALTMVLLFTTYQAYGSGSRPEPASAQSNTGNPIVRENSLPGSSGWKLTKPATNHQIEGYASATSAAAGATVHFSVSTTEPRFRVDTYRMGWYGGAGGRLVMSLSDIAGHAQPVPAPDPTTGLIECHWSIAFSVVIPDTWVTGVYMFVLTDSSGYQSYIPLVITDPFNQSAYLLIHASATDQAYNTWGGKSLYSDSSSTYTDSEQQFEHRARVVSFDRPYSNGSGSFFDWEYHMVRFLERNGYDMSYATDIDVNDQPALLSGHHAILIAGHDEYWSKGMRDHIEQAVSRGVNLGVFAANTGYWQVRFDPDETGQPDRIETCYKSATEDPIASSDPSLVTTLWRDPPVNRPESTLLGAMSIPGDYFAGGPKPLIIADPTSWVFAGTGLTVGDSIDGVVGYEFDEVVPSYPVPSNLDVLTASPAPDDHGNLHTANATVYVAPSGATVFNAGTIDWSLCLDQPCSSTRPPPPGGVSPLEKITMNILARFRQPVQVPPTPTATSTPLPTSTPTPTPVPTSTPTPTPSPTSTTTPRPTPSPTRMSTPSPTPTHVPPAASVTIDKVLILKRVRNINVSTRQIVHLGVPVSFFLLYHVRGTVTQPLGASLTITRWGRLLAQPAIARVRLGRHDAWRAKIVFRNRADLGMLYAHFVIHVGALTVKRDRRFYLVR